MGSSVKAPRQRRQAVEQASQGVGLRLRALRKAQKVTLVELAKTSGVDAATISRIETGQMMGTLGSHMKLATALGAKLTELYSGIEEARVKEGVTVQLVSERADVYIGGAGKHSITMLTTEVLKKKLMPVLVTIEPGGSTNQEEAKVGTEKFLYVLEGQVEARIGETSHVLKRGSTLYFDASITHMLKNTSKRTVRCLAVVTPPVL